jgi:hypothetical protein
MIEKELLQIEGKTRQAEQRAQQNLDALFEGLWRPREAWLNFVKAKFDTEARLLHRRLATTPLELASWLIMQ